MPHTVTVTIYRKDSICFIPVNFDPKAVFGKIRAPVKVTLNGYTYRSTIASRGGVTAIPLRKSIREAAGLASGERIAVTIELDAEPREVELPHDLARALRADKQRMKKWQSLSYTNRRERVEAIESAKRPATRTRRLASIVQSLDDGPWLIEHGLDLPLFVGELFSTRIGGFFGMDVLASAVTLIVFIRHEGSRSKLRLLWLPIGATCLIGVSCGLPLFLYLRERQLAGSSATV